MLSFRLRTHSRGRRFAPRVWAQAGIGSIVITTGLLVILGWSPRVLADVIWLRDGGKVVGKITAEEKTRVQIEIRRGKMSAKKWVLRKEIFQIEKGLTPDEEFEARLAKLDPMDLDGHRALLEFAKKNKIREGARRLEVLIPSVVARRFKIDHKRTWCRSCDASGKTTCQVCTGEGKVYDPCQRCEAKGAVACRVCRSRESADLRCRRCGGEGEYQRFDPKLGRKKLVKCDDCKGAGVQTCPTCKGKREVTCPLCEGKKGTPKKCPTCKGSPLGVCKVCTGSRLQPKPLTDEELEAERVAAEAAKNDSATSKPKDADSKDDGSKVGSPTDAPKAGSPATGGKPDPGGATTREKGGASVLS